MEPQSGSDEEFDEEDNSGNDWWGSDDEYLAPEIIQDAVRPIDHVALGTPETHPFASAKNSAEKTKPVFAQPGLAI